MLLLGEQAVTTLAAIPVGMLIGYGLAAAVSAGIRTDAYRIPFVVSTQTFLLAAGRPGRLTRRPIRQSGNRHRAP